jgi:hypothetical protein
MNFVVASFNKATAGTITWEDAREQIREKLYHIDSNKFPWHQYTALSFLCDTLLDSPDPVSISYALCSLCGTMSREKSHNNVLLATIVNTGKQMQVIMGMILMSKPHTSLIGFSAAWINRKGSIILRSVILVDQFCVEGLYTIQLHKSLVWI